MGFEVFSKIIRSERPYAGAASTGPLKGRNSEPGRWDAGTLPGRCEAGTLPGRCEEGISAPAVARPGSCRAVEGKTASDHA